MFRFRKIYVIPSTYEESRAICKGFFLPYGRQNEMCSQECSPLSFRARPVGRRRISCYYHLGEILHFTSFHSEWHCSVRTVSLTKRFFGVIFLRMKLMSSRTKVRDLMQNVLLGMRFFTLLTLRSEWKSDVITNICEESRTICKGFFLPTVVRMTCVFKSAVLCHSERGR